MHEKRRTPKNRLPSFGPQMSFKKSKSKLVSSHKKGLCFCSQRRYFFFCRAQVKPRFAPLQEREKRRRRQAIYSVGTNSFFSSNCCVQACLPARLGWMSAITVRFTKKRLIYDDNSSLSQNCSTFGCHMRPKKR